MTRIFLTQFMVETAAIAPNLAFQRWFLSQASSCQIWTPKQTLFPQRSVRLLFTAERSEQVSCSSARTCQFPAPCFPCPRFCSTFCTLSFTHWTVPHIRYCSPFHFGTRQVYPSSTGTALNHWASGIWLFTVTSNLVIFLWEIKDNVSLWYKDWIRNTTEH